MPPGTAAFQAASSSVLYTHRFRTIYTQAKSHEKAVELVNFHLTVASHSLQLAGIEMQWRWKDEKDTLHSAVDSYHGSRCHRARCPSTSTSPLRRHRGKSDRGARACSCGSSE